VPLVIVGIGLVGALIGGAIFRLFGIWPALNSTAISLRDLLAAFIGSLLFLLLVWMVRHRPWGRQWLASQPGPFIEPSRNADPLLHY
jgi:hypothetical protein